MVASMAEGTVTEGWLHDTLEQLIEQIRALLDVTGVAFVTVDEDREAIRPAAAWFVDQDASRAFSPLLARPYEPERGGVTEAAVESGTAVLIPRMGEWPGAEALRARLAESLAPEVAELAWDYYRSASFISAPVRTAGGRTFGVLAISANPPLRALSAEDLRTIEVFARLAALALERSELLEREAGLRREEGLLNRALQAVAASIDLEAVYRAIVEQAGELSGATMVMLTRYDPGQGELRHVAGRGVSERLAGARFRLGEGMIGRVAASGQPYVSQAADESVFIRWVVETQGARSFMHVPITLAGRLFGVLSATHEVPGRFGEDDLRRLAALGVGAAGAIAHALEFEHERRIARALTAGFVPEPPDPQTGLELGLVYEPVAHEVGGGDVFGVWTLPSLAVAVLIGDVSGKGLEVAAASAMVRFFVEARAWDTESPAEVLAQTNRILRTRLRRGGFATAFLAVVDGRAPALLQRRPPAAVPAARGRRVGAAARQRAAARRRGRRAARGARGRVPPRRRPLRRHRRAARGAARAALLRRRPAARAALGARRARRRRSSSPSACSRRRRSGRRCCTTTSSCSRCGARPSSSCATSPRAARRRGRCTRSTRRSCASGWGRSSSRPTRSSPASARSRRSAPASSSSTRAASRSRAAATARSGRR